MPLPADHAARRRDQRLARARRLTLWAAGGAAAASLGLGAAFAHALPGHHSSAPGAASGATSAGTQPTGTQPAGTQPTGTQPTGTQPTGAPASPRQQISPPAQPPATTTAPPQTTSGGS